MTHFLSAAGSAAKAIKAALGFRRDSVGGALTADPASTASLQRISSTLAEISTSLAAMRRQIDELHGRR